MAGEAGALQARLQAPPDWRRQRRFTSESHSRASSGDPAFHQWQADSGNLAAGVLRGIRWAALQACADRGDGRIGSGSFRPATLYQRLAIRLRIAGPSPGLESWVRPLYAAESADVHRDSDEFAPATIAASLWL